MTNPARDFIENELLPFVGENELLPFARQINAWKQIPQFIERNRYLWDTQPAQGLVDEEALIKAYEKDEYSGEMSYSSFVQAYEAAKLDKTCTVEMRVSTDVGRTFKVPEKKPLPPLPEKINKPYRGKEIEGVEFIEAAAVVDLAKNQNALIDYLAALGEGR